MDDVFHDFQAEPGAVFGSGVAGPKLVVAIGPRID
jgi:hypothetical protein